MLITVDGIVIARRKIGENNCFIDILTEKMGVIEATVHGAEKIGSRNSASSALFSYSTFCLKKNGSRYTVNSSTPKFNFHTISENIFSVSLAAYFSEVLRYTSATEEKGYKDELKFTAISFFELQKSSENEHSKIKSVFEFRHAANIGFSPNLVACSVCANYEHDEMYFFLEDGYILCGECIDDHENYKSTAFFINPLLLYTLRFVLYSPIEKIYKFVLDEKINKEFSIITENYLLYHLGRTFKTLQYYKDLRKL